MPNGDKDTEKEHYIPQFYLKGFSKDRKTIWQFDTNNPLHDPQKVPVKSICYEENMYEFKGELGETYPNCLENWLSVYERFFSKVLLQIKSKAYCKENYKTHCFLTSKEKASLVLCICLQILRTPTVLKVAKNLTDEILGDKYSETQKYNFILSKVLPLYDKLKEDESNMLTKTAEWFENMAYRIGVSYNSKVFTSDQPYYLYKEGGALENDVNPDYIIFPLASDLVLFMEPKTEKNYRMRNILFPMNNEDIIEVKKSIISASGRWIFSEDKFSNDDIKLIMDIKNGGK